MTRPPSQRPLPTVALALMTGFLLASGLFALLVVVIPGAAMMLLSGMLLTGFFALQYFVWGRRLYQYVLAQEQQRLSDEEATRTDSGRS